MSDEYADGEQHKGTTRTQSTMNETEYDVEQAKTQVKKQYESETGEELPDHVVENIELLNAAGPTISDLEDAMESGRQMASKDYSTYQVAALLLLSAVTVGAISFGAGMALAGSFGVAVVALVCVAFGFTVGALFT